MTSERKFIAENIRRVLLKEYLMKKTERAGFGDLDIQRTPLGTRVTLIAERPGMVIGRKGATIKELTRVVEDDFQFDNPQIEVQEAPNPNLNPQIMAQKLVSALERGWHFRRAGHSTVRQIMAAGAKGCQVIISGKLTGQRHRVEKFKEGHIKFCGEPKKQWMHEGFAVAKKKLGIIGVKVQIMDPNAKLPDEVEIIPDNEVEAILKSQAEAKAAAAPEEGAATAISGATPEIKVEGEAADAAKADKEGKGKGKRKRESKPKGRPKKSAEKPAEEAETGAADEAAVKEPPKTVEAKAAESKEPAPGESAAADEKKVVETPPTPPSAPVKEPPQAAAEPEPEPPKPEPPVELKPESSPKASVEVTLPPKEEPKVTKPEPAAAPEQAPAPVTEDEPKAKPEAKIEPEPEPEPKPKPKLEKKEEVKKETQGDEEK
jgi:small subunit ribosomal protein S3